MAVTTNSLLKRMHRLKRFRPFDLIDDPNDAREYRLGTTFDSPHFGERPIWEEGDDLDAMHQTSIEYTHRASCAREPLIQPSLSLSRSVRKIGIRKLIRQGFGRRIIEKISRRELVKASTYREYERRIEE